jgi:hypothetical protein
MTGSLRDEVNARLPWLAQEFGFRVANDTYDHKHMGNSLVELRSDSIHVRFIRDRSLIQVQVAAPAEPERWFELGFLWFALTGNQPDPELEGWAWFFRDHVAELSEALGPRFEETKASFNQRIKERSEIMRRHLPPRTLNARLLNIKSTPLVGSLLMGPLGWIVAGALLVWAIVR